MQGMMSFNNAVFDDIHSQTAKVRETYEEIWTTVRNEVMNLLQQEGVDQTLGSHVETRELEVENFFKLYDQDYGGMSTAMVRSQQVGNDGAHHMRTVMGGGGAA